MVELSMVDYLHLLSSVMLDTEREFECKHTPEVHIALRFPYNLPQYLKAVLEGFYNHRICMWLLCNDILKMVAATDVAFLTYIIFTKNRKIRIFYLFALQFYLKPVPPHSGNGVNLYNSI